MEPRPFAATRHGFAPSLPWFERIHTRKWTFVTGLCRALGRELR
jgi:hypothetical protein